MIAEGIAALLSWKIFVLALLVFGFAPGLVTRLLSLAYRQDDPRRIEMRAEIYRVAWIERPLWTMQSVERSICEGLAPRVRCLLTQNRARATTYFQAIVLSMLLGRVVRSMTSEGASQLEWVVLVALTCHLAVVALLHVHWSRGQFLRPADAE